MNKARLWWALGAVAVAAGSLWTWGAAATPTDGEPSVAGLVPMKAKTLRGGTSEQTFQVRFRATRGAVRNAVARVRSSDPDIVVVDGSVSVGDLAAGAEVTPLDTITVRLRKGAVFSADKLSYRFASLAAGPVVQVSVAVSDAGARSGALRYRWKSTDGNIVDTDAPTTRWTLPPGPGLHFAYVLVDNLQGGFTERRIAVNTDSIGTPLGTFTSHRYAAPAAPLPSGLDQRIQVATNLGELPLQDMWGNPVLHDVFSADALAYLVESTTGAQYPTGGPDAPLKVDRRGFLNMPNLPIGAYSGQVSLNGGLTWVSDVFYVGSDPGITTGRYVTQDVDGASTGGVVGRVRLSDDSPCGTINEFFGIDEAGYATLLDAKGVQVGPSVRLSADGDFGFSPVTIPSVSRGASVRINCQGAPTLNLEISAMDSLGNRDLGVRNVPGVKAPVVSGMTAVQNGSGASVGLFLPPPSGFPSDALSSPEHFLSYRGLDSQLSACQYYLKIGAVRGCDPQGGFIGAINVEDWRRTVKIGAYATPGVPEYAATYINQVDLNLTRNHHSISYGPRWTAAYVCNHLGPASLDATQAQINAAIDNAVAGKNLVACVMMDSIARVGVNNGEPYTRFLIFGPSGELLPSINLDGRREKFVPGVCVACHGGERYKGRFPEDGSGGANIGAHFLPYDVGNFAFSSVRGLRRVDQEAQIYNLNRNVLKAGATPAAQALIGGWYAAGHKADTNYLPPSWVGQGADEAYHKVYAKFCRTCHVNMPTDYNFDDFANASGYIFSTNKSCNNPAYHNPRSKWSMPNSLVTFNRFWKTQGTPDDLTAVLANFLASQGSPQGTPPQCVLQAQP